MVTMLRHTNYVNYFFLSFSLLIVIGFTILFITMMCISVSLLSFIVFFFIYLISRLHLLYCSYMCKYCVRKKNKIKISIAQCVKKKFTMTISYNKLS